MSEADLSILLVASIHMRVHAVGRKELEKEELRRGRRRHKARAPINRVNSPAMPMRGMIIRRNLWPAIRQLPLRRH